jgi:hypothetical protein
MVPQPTQHAGSYDGDFDDAERGLYDSKQSLTALPPLAHIDQKSWLDFDDIFSPIHEGITPSSSVPLLSLSWPAGWQPRDQASKNSGRPKPKITRWIRFQVWFTTYRKFFTFVTLLNLAGIIMASLHRFPYAEKHLGALVLGNLLCAILMRNELFLRVLYTIAIYGLRSARPFLCPSHNGR